MGLYTDSALAQTLPSTSGLSHEQLSRVAGDAANVYDYVQTRGGISECDVRTWGESAGIDPDRMNAALAVLREAGKLYSLPDGGPVTPPAPEAEAVEAKPRARRRAAAKRTAK